ncbi:MAG: pyruvate ferredoxin oxidoreductase [Patescibacteria group bacterium]
MNNKKQFLEGSRAIALTIKALKPAVVSAYPITPQTHIVEDLAKFKSDEKVSYEYVLAESEFAAASIVLGASATGARTYSATSSQGLLLMTEVLYNISGMRLPVVMTVANRAISAPINIWNDHSDIMAVRDIGAIMFFAETHQEAINQHILAYKLAEHLSLPALINVDGFILTHSYESCEIPATNLITKFLPPYQAKKGEFLDPKNPITMGTFVSPQYYSTFRNKLQQDLLGSLKLINKEYLAWKKIFKTDKPDKKIIIDNGWFEYYGKKNAKTIIAAMGSMCGTIKEAIDEVGGDVAVLKIRCFRPFPGEEIRRAVKNAKKIIILEKALSLGAQAPLFSDLASALYGEKIKLVSHVIGLGGEDITEKQIIKIIKA